MARFHFNVFDGTDLPDVEGEDLADWEEARIVAIRRAGLIIADPSKRAALSEDWRMEVTDEYGLVLFRLDFSIAEAPVLSGRSYTPMT